MGWAYGRRLFSKHKHVNQIGGGDDCLNWSGDRHMSTNVPDAHPIYLVVAYGSGNRESRATIIGLFSVFSREKKGV